MFAKAFVKCGRSSYNSGISDDNRISDSCFMESAFGNQNKISLHAVTEPSDVFNVKMTQGLTGTFRVPDFPDNGSVDFAIGGPGLETQDSHVVHA